MTRPLIGSTCRLSLLIEELGGKTTRFPVIRLESPQASEEFRLTLANLDQFDTVVFVSGSGVRFFLAACSTDEINQLKSLRIGAIGEATARDLAAAGLQADFTPADSNSESLADKLIELASDKPYLIVRAEQASPHLATRLNQERVRFQEVAAYFSTGIQSADPWIAARLAVGGFDWIPLTSSTIAQNTIRLFGDSLNQTNLASLSPAISTVIEKLGFSPAAEASESNFPSLVKAMLDATKKI